VHEQYPHNYREENNISIDILTDDCLGHIFKYLSIANRLRSIERGEYSILHRYSVSHRLLQIDVIYRYRYSRIHTYMYTCIFITVCCKLWKAASWKGSWYLIKTLVLSPNGLGFTTFHTIDNDMFTKLIAKCSKHIFRIIYKDYKLHSNIDNRLSNYISTHCFNVRSLDLSATILHSSQIKILAQNCKKIEKQS